MEKPGPEPDSVLAAIQQQAPHRQPSLPTALPVAPRQSPWRSYLLALLIVSAATVTLLAVSSGYPWFGYQTVGLVELFVILLIAIYLGRGPALLAALVSVVSWNFLFISPRFTFAISDPEDALLVLLYFVIAILTGNLTARLRQQERVARYNAERTAALYALAHETATAANIDDVLHTAVDQIGRVFDAEVAILLHKGDQVERQPHKASTLHVDDKAFAVAAWVFENGTRAGRFSATLPDAAVQCLPLRTPNRTVGVLCIQLHAAEPPALDQDALLDTFAGQVAVVIERELLDEAAEQALMLRESERLYTALLSSISHELRTPIATITGAASLLDSQVNADTATRRELTRDIQSAADRLNRLVANLLDMSRLDAGRLSLKLDWCDAGEVIGVAVQQLHDDLAQRPLSIHVAPDLPLVKMDFVLMEQVLVNLLDNACAYTPPNAPISIDAALSGNQLRIMVTDGGPGIPAADLGRIFEKFYRVAGTATGGTGLGLSICRGLVEAHGGALQAANVPGAGARFTITLPASTPPPPVKEAML